MLASLPAESVHCVVTSPPYFGLRSYIAEGDPLKPLEIGLEQTIDEYITKMVGVFREVRRVLRSDGVAWVNMGDSYANDGKWVGATSGKHCDYLHGGETRIGREKRMTGLKPKDLCGAPWRLAFALQSDGWWLRQDIIWAKPNPMPESVTDRCTKSHEYVFLLSKSATYFYDAEAIKEPAFAENEHDATGQGMFAPGQTPQRGNRKIKMPDGWDTGPGGHGSFHREGREKGRTNDSWKGSTFDGPRDLAVRPDVGRGRASGNKTHKGVTEYEASDSEEHRTKAGLLKISETPYALRNKRSVWTVATAPFSEAHFATFPPALIEPCILAGCPKGGTVLDPFFGAGTTGLVADRLGRDCIGIELNDAYVAMARKRLAGDCPLFAEVLAG